MASWHERFDSLGDGDLYDAIPPPGRSLPVRPPSLTPLELHRQELNARASFIFTFPIPEDAVQPNERQLQRLKQYQHDLHRQRHYHAHPQPTATGATAAAARSGYVDERAEDARHALTERAVNANAEFGGSLSEILTSHRESEIRRRYIDRQRKNLALQRNGAAPTSTPTVAAAVDPVSQQSTQSSLQPPQPQRARPRPSPTAPVSQSSPQPLSQPTRPSASSSTSASARALAASPPSLSSPSPAAQNLLPLAQEIDANLLSLQQQAAFNAFRMPDVSLEQQQEQARAVSRALQDLLQQPNVDIQSIAASLGVSVREADQILGRMQSALSRLSQVVTEVTSPTHARQPPSVQRYGIDPRPATASAPQQQRDNAAAARPSGDSTESPNVSPTEATAAPPPRAVPSPLANGGLSTPTAAAASSIALPHGHRFAPRNFAPVIAPYAWLGPNRSNPNQPPQRSRSQGPPTHGSDQQWEINDFTYENLLELGSMAVCVGLTKQQIAKIPSFVFPNPKNKSAECSICLERFQSGDVCLLLACEHAFHRGCISIWLMRNKHCPCCRHDVCRAKHR